MNFAYYNEDELLRMILVIGNYPASTGRHVLKRLDFGQSECALGIAYASLTSVLDDGDVGGPSFQLVEEAGNNELVITHYDSATRQIAGHFQMTLAGQGSFYVDDLYFPDTLRITYGTFDLKLNPPEE